MQKIMIVEDDRAIREELELLLGNEGYCPVAVTDFTEIPRKAAEACPDLIILDICLPGAGIVLPDLCGVPPACLYRVEPEYASGIKS